MSKIIGGSIAELIRIGFMFSINSHKTAVKNENLIDSLFYRKICDIISYKDKDKIESEKNRISKFIKHINLKDFLDEIDGNDIFFSEHIKLLIIIMDDVYQDFRRNTLIGFLKDHKLKDRNGNAQLTRELFFGDIELLKYLPVGHMSFLSDEYYPNNHSREILKSAGVKEFPDTEEMEDIINTLNSRDECNNILLYLYENDRWRTDFYSLGEYLGSMNWFINKRGDKISLRKACENDIIEEYAWKNSPVFLAWLGLNRSHDIDLSTCGYPLITDKDASQILHRIAQWWNENNATFQNEYNKKAYGSSKGISLDFTDNISIESRKDWLRLFLTGRFHTMGRFRLYQHRSFIDKLETEGWLNQIASQNTEMKVWIEFLEDYIDHGKDDQQQYYHWMTNFIAIYQLSKHLDSYISQFSRIDRYKDKLSNISQITHFFTNPMLSGSGIDAPSIERTFGSGISFVLRELYRLGIISNNNAHKYAFMCSKRIRDLLEQLGCGFSSNYSYTGYSEDAFNFFIGLKNDMEFDITFNNCFDLPFDIILEKQDLKNEFFGNRLDLSKESDENYL